MDERERERGRDIRRELGQKRWRVSVKCLKRIHLYIMGLTLFVYKNAAYGDEAYLKYLCDIELVNDYAYGLDTLAYLFI